MTPIIVTALFGNEDFAYLDGLRRQHFPPDRNQVPAHLTLFHHLPPDAEAELKRRLADLTRNAPAPQAWLGGIVDLGRGTAFRVESPDLQALRDELADAFSGLLIPQDRAGWRPHVTIQNKVPPADAKTLQAELRHDFARRSLAIVGVATWRYLGGPWDLIARHKFA